MRNNEEFYIEASRITGIPVEVVREAYRSFWKFIKKGIEEMPLKDADEEDFKNLRTSFNIPSLGKIGCTEGRFKAIKENYKLKQLINERDKTHEDSGSHSEQDSHNSKEV